MAWLPIEYRGFYDVPRAFLVEYRGERYLFECPFDERIDDYADYFDVYRLRPPPEEVPDSWGERTVTLQPDARVRVADVVFDRTKRRQIDDGVFRQLPRP